jgi:LytS/YehU family sensor histidine kinase
MLERLSDLLRLTLDRIAVQQVSLREELEFVEKYLEIEQTRFGSRLRLRMSVDPATLDASVPNLLLQPLVENAVRHGVARRTGRAAIRIGVRRQGGELQLEVCDRGEGLVRHGGRPAREGVGLSNTRSRLEQLYGPAAALWLNDAPGGGACVGVTLPFHVQPERVHVAAAGA